MGENRLATERSSYLRSAANQPVNWYPWGEEAFRKAKTEDKPILLDVGAVWCHWCHVIDRESYEDAKLAKVINENFVAVEVVVDGRPVLVARCHGEVHQEHHIDEPHRRFGTAPQITQPETKEYLVALYWR